MLTLLLRRLWFFLFVLFVVACNSGVTPSPTPLPTLYLATRDLVAARDGANSIPIAGARVQVGERVEMTDEQGRFKIGAFDRGTCLRITADGYLPGEWLLTPPVPKVFELDSLEASATPAPDHLTCATPTPIRTRTPTPTFTPSPTPTPDGRHSPTPTPAVKAQAKVEPLILRFDAARRTGLLTTSRSTGVGGALVWFNTQLATTDARGAFSFPASGALPGTLTLKLRGYKIERMTANAASRATITPFAVHAVHIYYGMPKADVLQLLDRLAGTEINAVVLDVKSDGGEISWPSRVPLAAEISASAERDLSPPDMVAQCRGRKLYCIARLVVMKDDLLAYAHPELALHTVGGQIFADETAAWLNPAKPEVRRYSVALATELVKIGFDEVQLDYIRYPGDFGIAEFGTPETRVEAISALLAEHQKAFAQAPAFLSADVFGLTTFTDDENNIGQRMRDVSRYVDYISPMVYPDLYTAGMLDQLDISDCSAPRRCPYKMVLQNVKYAQTRSSALIRPWLQGYGWTTPEYLQEKNAANDAGAHGWMFWNNEGDYEPALFQH